MQQATVRFDVVAIAAVLLIAVAVHADDLAQAVEQRLGAAETSSANAEIPQKQQEMAVDRFDELSDSQFTGDSHRKSVVSHRHELRVCPTRADYGYHAGCSSRAHRSCRSW